ncbi:MAG TPA: sodium:solute symporter family protein [Gemmatimonadales bacterium]|nr:sodium:solute symporter family protein [Gemmatimonadales bacterium]
MELSAFDWGVILVYGVVTVAVGLAVARRAGQGTGEFFLSGRSLPWWALGVSLVATTFSTDTPNLVTDMVRTGGVSQNWSWWAFLLTGMCTVFFYARLWRRSEVMTDIGFYELRYSGRPAAFLRGFRAIYLGVFFNVMIMASVNLAAMKISSVLLGFDREVTLLVCAAVTVLYAASSGLRGVVLTDVLQFGVAMVGAVMAAWYALAHPAVGGLAGLLSHPEVARRTAMLPDFGDWRNAVMVFVIPVTVQWWSTWYPGSEPGGGGYVAQRMLAARNERESLLSVLAFNVLHYGLRPWPWILVALASLVVYPDLAAIQARFPHLDPRTLGNDLGYPAMLVFLPAGLLGLMLASLAAAYMSTISTHLNWGASYVVEDWYRRFVARDRSERHYVAVARVATVVLVALAAVVSLALESAFRTFAILLQIGAGTGLIYLLRWYWWRVNAWSEIAGMVISFAVAVYFEVLRPRSGLPPMDAAVQLVIGVAITTVGWVAVTLLTPPTDAAVLRRFHDRIRPGGPGWRRIAPAAPDGARDNLPAAFLCWFLGVTLVYAAMFAIGSLLYGETVAGLFYSVVVVGTGAWLFRTLPRVGVL